MNIFTAVKYYCILHGRVCVMVNEIDVPDEMLLSIMVRTTPVQ